MSLSCSTAGSEYAGGVYHGKVIFPAEYPFKAPNVVMCTPSGRFEPNAKICMSMTAFHPESWNPVSASLGACCANATAESALCLTPSLVASAPELDRGHHFNWQVHAGIWKTDVCAQ